MSKKINPNEASLIRWIATIIVGYILGGVVLLLPWILIKVIFPDFIVNSPFGFMASIIELIIPFFFLFLGTAIAIKWVAKTSLRDFLFKGSSKLKKKDYVIILSLYALGMIICQIPALPDTTLRGIEPGQFLLLFVFCSLFVWAQTSWEELIFRGIFIRYACKNDIKMSKKAVLWGWISSLLFMVIHGLNPEVLSQSGWQVIPAIISYAIPGMGLYFANIYYKSLVPGLLIHWLNNFVNFVLISGSITAGGSPSLFVDTSSTTGFKNMLACIIVYIPLYLYFAYQIYKKKKLA